MGEHTDEVHGHDQPDDDPCDAAGDGDGAGLGADEQPDGSGLQALRSQGDVFAAALEQKAEDEDGDRHGSHGERVGRVEQSSIPGRFKHSRPPAKVE